MDLYLLMRLSLMKNIEYTRLDGESIDLVRTIDRSEVIDNIYYMRDGRLVLEEEHWELKGWPPGEPAENIEWIDKCLDRGGAAWGAFDGDILVGVGVLDGKWIGTSGDTLVMYFLHVSADYRAKGIGRTLIDLVRDRAMEMGARRLYVSATPSLNTVRFYQRMGFDLASEVDPELFEWEPEDIHMDMDL